MSEWGVKQFGDCATLVRETVSPSKSLSVPYIGLEHIAENSLSLLGHGTAKDVTSIKSRFQAGDILFGKLRPYFRKVVRAPFDGVCSTDIWVVRPKHDMDIGFIFYWMSSLNFVDSSMRGSEGTKMPRAKWDFVARIVQPVPPLSEQRAIAEILGSLDDKIELNRRMNETLEQMARAIFKSWFVDFDPVRAKMDGRWKRGQSLPGLPAELFDLFPERLVNSQLGDIPEGWKVGILQDVAEHRRRAIQPNGIDPSTPYIALEHMPRCCIALGEWGISEGVGSNKFAFKRGDILFGKLRPYFHKVGVAPVDGVCSTDIVVIAPKAVEWFGFVLAHVSSDAFVKYANAGATGTKMPRTSWGEMGHYAVALPPASVAEGFTSHIRSAVDRVIVQIHESRALAATRDALLPKLLSGRLKLCQDKYARA